MDKKIKGVYIVLTHNYVPSKTDSGKWEVTEQCEFVSNIKDKHYTSATAILDYRNKSVIKNRAGDSSGDSYEALMDHVKSTYPENIDELDQLIGE